MVNDSYFRFDDDNKIKYTFSRSSQENWVSWRHTNSWHNCKMLPLCPGSSLKLKIICYQFRKSHGGNKTILRPSYLHNGISYTGKMTFLYWIRTQASVYWICNTPRYWCPVAAVCISKKWPITSFKVLKVLMKITMPLQIITCFMWQ